MSPAIKIQITQKKYNGTKMLKNYEEMSEEMCHVCKLKDTGTCVYVLIMVEMVHHLISYIIPQHFSYMYMYMSHLSSLGCVYVITRSNFSA